jgi:hypothetical protein
MKIRMFWLYSILEPDDVAGDGIDEAILRSRLGSEKQGVFATYEMLGRKRVSQGLSEPVRGLVVH